MTGGRAVLVFLPYCPDSIGEQVVQIPFLRLLRAEHPGLRIVAVAPERSSGVIAELGLVDEIVEHGVRAGPRDLRRIARSLRRLPCERAYVLRRKSLRAALLARMATSAPLTGFAHGASSVYLSRSVPFDHGSYVGENYVRLLGRRLSDFVEDPPRTPDGRIVIVPGGRTAIKRYPVDGYLEVARALGAERPVHFLLGPGPDAEWAALTARPRPFHVHVGLSIPEVRKVIRRASLVVANDCGPGHFAHIEDIPRISLFSGSVDSAHWFRPGRHGRLLQSPGERPLSVISPSAVLELAREILARESSAGGPAAART